jgi:integrase
MEFAVASNQLGENPLRRVKTRRTAAVTEVDPRVVVTHAQARDLLTAVSYVGSWDRGRGRRLVAFFGVLYYAGLRPAEAVALRESDCALPEEGWGTLTLARSLPVTTNKWTDHGERHDPRGLKQRDANAVRVVPIPPWLVTILREHVATYAPQPTAASSATNAVGSSARQPTQGSGKKLAN